jgi:hypothetical protein
MSEALDRMPKAVLLALVALLVGPGVVAAEELKTRISASMFLDLTAPRASAREAAYQESIRSAPPVAPRPPSGEVQEDGSVRYGNVTVTVRNPCPPGSGHEEPMPLPGRRSK